MSLLGCLIAGNTAFAALPDDPHHDHDRDDVRFECAFRGTHLRKVPIFCEAHGRIDTKVRRDHFITGDRDDRLTVTCEDHLIYDDNLIYGLFSNRDDRDDDNDNHDGDHHDGDRDDRFFDVKLLSLTPFTAAIAVEDASINGFEGGSDRSKLTVTLWDRIPVTLLGSCHFRHEHDHDDDHGDHDLPPPVR